MKSSYVVVLLLLGAAFASILVFTALRTWHLISYFVPPDQTYAAYAALGCFDGGPVLWGAVAVILRRHAWIRGMALFMSGADLVGAMVTNFLDLRLVASSAHLLAAPPDAVTNALVAVWLVIFLNLIFLTIVIHQAIEKAIFERPMPPLIPPKN